MMDLPADMTVDQILRGLKEGDNLSSEMPLRISIVAKQS
jgi:hypothetical protein